MWPKWHGTRWPAQYKLQIVCCGFVNCSNLHLVACHTPTAAAWQQNGKQKNKNTITTIIKKGRNRDREREREIATLQRRMRIRMRISHYIIHFVALHQLAASGNCHNTARPQRALNMLIMPRTFVAWTSRTELQLSRTTWQPLHCGRLLVLLHGSSEKEWVGERERENECVCVMGVAEAVLWLSDMHTSISSERIIVRPKRLIN